MDWIIDHWQYVLIGFYLIEKVVLISRFKWDDIVWSGLKAIALGLYNLWKKP